MSDCILQGKYAAWPEMLEFIGWQLGDVIKGCVPPRTIVVPVPMPRIRKWLRRIDHAATIANAVAKTSGLPVRSMLSRKDAPPQAGLTASGRRTLKRNSMRVRYLARVKGRSVLLVDDVLTTGTTLEIACQTLLAAGASHVMIAVAAVTELPNQVKKM